MAHEEVEPQKGQEEERNRQLRERLQREAALDAPVADLTRPQALPETRAIDRLLIEPVLNKLEGQQIVELARSVQEYEIQLEKVRAEDIRERLRQDRELAQREREHQREQRVELVRILTRPVIAVGMVVAGVVLSLHGSADLGATLLGGAVSVLIGEKIKKGTSDGK